MFLVGVKSTRKMLIFMRLYAFFNSSWFLKFSIWCIWRLMLSIGNHVRSTLLHHSRHSLIWLMTLSLTRQIYILIIYFVLRKTWVRWLLHFNLGVVFFLLADLVLIWLILIILSLMNSILILLLYQLMLLSHIFLRNMFLNQRFLFFTLLLASLPVFWLQILWLLLLAIFNKFVG